MSRVHEGSSCAPNVLVNIWWVFHYRRMTMLYMHGGCTLTESARKETLLALIASWSELLRLTAQMLLEALYCGKRGAERAECWLNMSVWVGGLGVIHMRTALFAFPSSPSLILSLPLILFRIPCLLALPFPTFPFPFTAHHCFTVLQPHPISLFAASSVVLPCLFSVCTHTYTLAPYCMTEVPIPAPSITSTYSCQQAVRAATGQEWPASKWLLYPSSHFWIACLLSTCKHTDKQTKTSVLWVPPTIPS